jgi:hypothetical protein
MRQGEEEKNRDWGKTERMFKHAVLHLLTAAVDPDHPLRGVGHLADDSRFGDSGLVHRLQE